MENDFVRQSGEDTVVDLWLDGQSRAITVSKSAIDAYLRQAGENTPIDTAADRCEFVRTHLLVVSGAAAAQIWKHPRVETIALGPGDLPHHNAFPAAGAACHSKEAA